MTMEHLPLNLNRQKYDYPHPCSLHHILGTRHKHMPHLNNSKLKLRTKISSKAWAWPKDWPGFLKYFSFGDGKDICVWVLWSKNVWYASQYMILKRNLITVACRILQHSWLGLLSLSTMKGNWLAPNGWSFLQLCGQLQYITNGGSGRRSSPDGLYWMLSNKLCLHAKLLAKQYPELIV